MNGVVIFGVTVSTLANTDWIAMLRIQYSRRFCGFSSRFEESGLEMLLPAGGKKKLGAGLVGIRV